MDGDTIIDECGKRLVFYSIPESLNLSRLCKHLVSQTVVGYSDVALLGRLEAWVFRVRVGVGVVVV